MAAEHNEPISLARKKSRRKASVGWVGVPTAALPLTLDLGFAIAICWEVGDAFQTSLVLKNTLDLGNSIKCSGGLGLLHWQPPGEQAMLVPWAAEH